MPRTCPIMKGNISGMVRGAVTQVCPRHNFFVIRLIYACKGARHFRVSLHSLRECNRGATGPRGRAETEESGPNTLVCLEDLF